ncbi:hypothetical protein Ddye_002749 [Dipteronia dyeriana]|uniref:Glycoside hydrolase family 5 domain-containing protein n=1 Tax=Dipteronia dyeriana TaxID=168575 RepID=A0AAD9XRR3_9ROSI|nr:hypothetical protein Ddye_002749 [Dipteronia dyeriana]
MLAEGLHKKPLKDIVAKLVQLKFNCAKQGIAKNNPTLLNMSHAQAFEAVVDELGKQGIMMVLDNHVSNPKWCCADEDGNGFFKDADFNPLEWQWGPAIVAQKFSSKNQVVAMSLRNELRGSRQNEQDWYRYIVKGARMVHKANPDVLVIVSGLNWGTDLSFLRKNLWALQGNYYLRDHTNAEETFGILDINWDHLNPNSNFPTSYILYHPESGKCIGANVKNEVFTSNSRRWWSRRWSQDGDGGPIRLMGSALCLKVVGDGLPPILSSDCLSQQSAWKSVSKSNLHLAAKMN